MAVLVYGSFLFGLSFLLHIVLWRIHLPRRQTRVIFLLFFGVLVFGSLLIFKYSSIISFLGYYPPVAILEYVQIWLFFTSLTLAYMITYSAIEADSPSIVIILKISEAGSSGIDKELFEREIDNSILITPRVNDLLRDNLAELTGGKYRLKAKGILMARLFTFYRNIMKAGKGG
ncbi:hypothetical protein ACFL1R_01880 [Candidatus Latescibacterota bacterium]